MRFICVFMAAMLFSSPIYSAPCTTQLYSDSEKEPNFNCPGPGEDQMVYPKTKPAQPTVAVKKGDKVSAGGILMHRDKAQRLGSRITGLRRLRYEGLMSMRTKHQAELALQKSLSEASAELYKVQREDYKKQLKYKTTELESANRWYMSFAFGLVVGIVATTAAAVGIGYAVK